MAVTNAISAIVIVERHAGGGIDERPLAKAAGIAGYVALAAVNIFGGFLVTRRMLEMFKKKDKPGQEGGRVMHASTSSPASTLLASICFIQSAQGRLSHPTTSIRGNLFGAGRHDDRRA